MTRQMADLLELIGSDVTLGTSTDAEIGLFRGDGGYLRLYVLASDGSGSVEFVHTGTDDRDQSIAFLWSLSQHANRMAEELRGQHA